MKQFIFKQHLFKHQSAFRKSRKREKALVGGYGCGKSRIIGIETLDHSMLDSGIPHMIVSPSYKMAKRTIIPSMKEIFEKCFDPPLRKGIDYTFNKTDFEYRFPLWNGLIWIGSAQDPDSLKGANLGSFCVDEPGKMKFKEVREQMLARLRHPDAKFLQGSYAGTPEGIDDFSEFVEGEDKPPDHKFDDIRGSSRDNTELDDSYVETMLEAYDEQSVQSYIDGIFVNMGNGSAYHAYNNDNLITNYDLNPYLPIHLGMDFNYTPNTAIACQEQPNGDIIAFKEFYKKNYDTDAKCELIIHHFDGEMRRIGHNPNEIEYIIYPDAAAKSRVGHGVGKSDLSMVHNAFQNTNFQVRIRNANPMRIDRMNAVNGVLCNGKGTRRLKVVKCCKYLIKDFRLLPKEEFLGGNIKDKDLGHITDAIGYYIEKQFPVQRDWRNHSRESKFTL